MKLLTKYFLRCPLEGCLLHLLVSHQYLLHLHYYFSVSNPLLYLSELKPFLMKKKNYESFKCSIKGAFLLSPLGKRKFFLQNMLLTLKRKFLAHDKIDILRSSCRDQLIDDVCHIKTTNMAETSGKQLSAVVFNDIFFDDWIS